MNSRERFFNTMKRLPTDRVPVIPYAGNFAPGLLGVPLDKYYNDGVLMARVQLEAANITGVDAVIPQSDGYYIVEGMGVKTRPSPNALPVYISSEVKELKDVLKLKVPDPYKDGRMPVYLEAIARLKQDAGKEKVIRCPGTGMFSLAGHVLGIQNLITTIAMAELDDDDEVRKYIFHLMEVCTLSLAEFIKACFKEGADFLMCGDSLASLNMTSPIIYEKYIYPFECMFFNEINKLKEQRECYNFLHICGDNGKVKHLLANTGCDALEIDYGVDLAAYKREIGDKVCLMGNLNPAGTLLHKGPDDVYKECMEVLKVAAGDGHFILGSGCEVAIGTPAENIRAMVKAAEDFASI